MFVCLVMDFQSVQDLARADLVQGLPETSCWYSELIRNKNGVVTQLGLMK